MKKNQQLAKQVDQVHEAWARSNGYRKKPQATSIKRQAPGATSNKHQASSTKAQASSHKRQAP